MLFLFVLKKHLSIYSIAFLEGGALLSFEIMVSRVYTPHIGSTLYVWTSILATTLIALALAYHLSHRFIQKAQWKVIPFVLALAFLYILFVTFGSRSLLESTYTLSIETASLLVGLMLVTVPVFCMGLVSPMLASLLNQKNNKLGQYSGIIYGISTLSGVAMTLISIFYLMPNIGVEKSLVVIASMLLIAFVLSLISLKKNVV